MIESEQAAKLFDEWRRLEVRLGAVKRELAGILGVSANGAPAKPPADGASKTDPAIAVGTKGRATLEVIKAHGGQAKAGPVKAALVVNGTVPDGPKADKQVRGYFNHLRKLGYLAQVKGQRGNWALTAKARSAMEDEK